MSILARIMSIFRKPVLKNAGLRPIETWKDEHTYAWWGEWADGSCRKLTDNEIVKYASRLL